MGNGMNKVLPGLYVGSYRDSKDVNQLEKYEITHVIAIHDSPKRLYANLHYLMIMASDSPDQNLTQYFPLCNDFIHSARLQEKNVLIHCLAGMSRSVTVCVAYIMSVTNLNWQEALKVVRSGRQIANPNKGFQSQLQDFEMFKLEEERLRLKERYPSLALIDFDRENCDIALKNYEVMLARKTICEGSCKKGENCPTGVCRADQKANLRRKQSQSSNLSLNSITSTSSNSRTRSCPSSPRHSKHLDSASRCVSLQDDDEIMELRDSIPRPSSMSLSRSSSIASNHHANRGYQGPRGLMSYTSPSTSKIPTSAPPSLRNSRIDLSSSAYGCSPGSSGSSSGRPSSAGTVINVVSRSKLDRTASRTSLSSLQRGSSASSNSSGSGNIPTGKPPPSPKRTLRRYNAS
ncbi:dual specificity protein phosphatase 15 [Culicoides brevitarsis]|uniref:dual specificity protein phosphatase 15 n=1 Tax=Culicoides brevitarsis TaxID=469753 RepID=UPI00307C1460